MNPRFFKIVESKTLPTYVRSYPTWQEGVYVALNPNAEELKQLEEDKTIQFVERKPLPPDLENRPERDYRERDNYRDNRPNRRWS